MRIVLMLSAVLCIACGSSVPAPPVLQKTQRGQVMSLSVAAPVTEAQVQAVIDVERTNPLPGSMMSGPDVVHVFVYESGKTPGKDQPSARWEWVRGGSLKRNY